MPNPSVVLDTNVLVSSLWRGRCWDVVKQWRDGRFKLAVSRDVLREYLDVLARFVDPDLLTDWADNLGDTTRVLFVDPIERLDVIPEDPADNRFLECAIAAHAIALVSGDRHLLRLKTFREIAIVTPAAFLQQLTH